MGLLDRFFGERKTKILYGGSPSVSASFNGEAYEHDVVRSVIDCIATHVAKSDATHVVLDKDDRIKAIKRNSPYVKLLNQNPNSLMSGYDLKYKLATHLQDKTTALCWVEWDGMRPKSMIPIPAKSFEIAGVSGGGYAVVFSDMDGIERMLNIEDVVILRKFYNTREVSGDGNRPIYDTLDLLTASDQGLKQAVTVSNKVRGLLKQKKAMLSDSDVLRSQEEFADRFRKAAENGGIVGIDAMEDYREINVAPWSATALQMRDIRERVLRYWRVSDEILRSDYTEAQWQSFYESIIEPILLQMSQAFTNVCFTQAERDAGNRIMFHQSVLMNMSTKTKVEFIKSTKELGLLTRNEQRAIFGYAPVEGCDEAVVSLNYVKASDQTAYQIGADPDQVPAEDEPEDGAGLEPKEDPDES